jgi:hypothetical protein
MHLSEKISVTPDCSINAVQYISVVIIDGMAVVNEITKDASLKTCKHVS